MDDYSSWTDRYFAEDHDAAERFSVPEEPVVPDADQMAPGPWLPSDAPLPIAAPPETGVAPESFAPPPIALPPEVPTIEELLAYAVKHSASDVHITVGLPPMVRVNGVLGPIPHTPVLGPEDTFNLAHSVMGEHQSTTLEQDLEVDFSFGRPGVGRFRVNAFHERGNISAALRRIPDEPPHLEDLGLPPAVNSIAELRNGLVLVTGPAGSGKSTTLAALIDKINRESCVHVITIEDPIEFVHEHNKSVVQQREVEMDTISFARALKSALREDPDVLLIGEMRDLETIAAAVSAAETGHLVLATLHTSSAIQAIDRIIDVFPPYQQSQIRLQLSSSLQAVLAQRLVPTVDGPRACVVELLLVNPAVRNLIREGKTHNLEQAMQSGIEDGMMLFDMNLARLVREGRIAPEVGISHANDPKTFSERVGR